MNRTFEIDVEMINKTIVKHNKKLYLKFYKVQTTFAFTDSPHFTVFD